MDEEAIDLYWAYGFQYKRPFRLDHVLEYHRLQGGIWYEVYEDKAYEITGTILAQRLEVEYQVEILKDSVIYSAVNFANTVLRFALRIVKRIFK